MSLIILNQTDEWRTIVNTETGITRKVKMASDKQWAFLEVLRLKHGKQTPMKARPAAFACSKSIKNYLKKENQQTLV